MEDKKSLPITEELDFAYLLELMLPLHKVPEFAWLPELFSIIGYDALLKLCKYAGGENITIPKLSQLHQSIDALQWFYDIYITGKHSIYELPTELADLVYKIYEVYDVRNGEEINS